MGARLLMARCSGKGGLVPAGMQLLVQHTGDQNEKHMGSGVTTVGLHLIQGKAKAVLLVLRKEKRRRDLKKLDKLHVRIQRGTLRAVIIIACLKVND